VSEKTGREVAKDRWGFFAGTPMRLAQAADYATAVKSACAGERATRDRLAPYFTQTSHVASARRSAFVGELHKLCNIPPG
jgi:hypothetical protein